MEFEVSRTAGVWDGVDPITDDERPPIEGARSAKRVTTLSTLADGDYHTSDHWLGEGFNHRFDGAFALRDQDVWVWVVDIDTPEALIEFQKRAGHPVILSESPATGQPRLEIYDDWREP